MSNRSPRTESQTDNPIDRLGFGCVPLTTLASPAAARDLLEGVLDLGIHHFDTAPIYGQGYSEKLLGEFLRENRSKVTVATKFGSLPRRPPALPTWVALPLNNFRKAWSLRQGGQSVPIRADAAWSPMRRSISRSDVAAAFDSSRRALRTDFIDLYLLHEAVPSALEPEAFELLQDLRSGGHIHQLGIAANHNSYQLLTREQVSAWDVLQYESGPAWTGSDGLMARFPDQTHIFHSCLRGVDCTRMGGEDTPGGVLADRLSKNPKGKVLFSSTNIDHVSTNVRVVASCRGSSCRS
jgi:aryl-alcohol dehydrogenase-like predicted oxidoreductase